MLNTGQVREGTDTLDFRDLIEIGTFVDSIFLIKSNKCQQVIKEQISTKIISEKHVMIKI